MAKIGLLTSNDISVRNMEHVTYRLSEIFSTKYQVNLVGALKVSERIRERFTIYEQDDEQTYIDTLLCKIPVLNRVCLLNKYIKSENPKLLIALGAIGVNGLAVSIAGRINGIPTIIRVTSDVFRVCRTEYSLKRKFSLFVRNNLLGRLAMLLSTKIVLLHEAQIPELKKSGFTTKKMVVAPQPVDFPEKININDLRVATRQKYLIPDDAYCVGSVFRLDFNKKLNILFETICKVLKQNESVYFIIAGNGNGKDWLYDNLPKDRVVMVGELPRDELTNIYAACDCFIHCSDSEGLANAIIEPMFFNKPIIATDSGVITRALVSNIANTYEEISAMIINKKAIVDPLPSYLKPKFNRERWLRLVEEVLVN
jgi:glycosyltransferase involved in cell wall biosynthesis